MGYGHEDPAAAGFEARYRELYRERFNQNAPETSASDGQLLLDRLEHYPTEELEHWLQMFFASDFIHFRRQNHSLRCFLESLTILRLAKPTAQGYLSTPRERSSGSS